MAEGRTSPWVWVGCGCLLAILAAVGAVVGVSWWGVRTAQRWGEELKDPATQREKTLAALGAEELPPGLYPGGHLSIPFLMDLTILSNEPPQAGGSGEVEIDEVDHGLVYVTSRALAHQREDLRAFLAGEKGDPEALRNLEITIGDYALEAGQETVARGAFAIGDTRYLYATQRQRHGSSRGERARLESLVMVQCPDDDRLRLAIWFGPDPAAQSLPPDPDAPPAPADRERPVVELTGTPADEEMLRELFATFDLCR